MKTQITIFLKMFMYEGLKWWSDVQIWLLDVVFVMEIIIPIIVEWFSFSTCFQLTLLIL